MPLPLVNARQFVVQQIGPKQFVHPRSVARPIKRRAKKVTVSSLRWAGLGDRIKILREGIIAIAHFSRIEQPKVQHVVVVEH
jgi:hypothetical protein